MKLILAAVWYLGGAFAGVWVGLHVRDFLCAAPNISVTDKWIFSLVVILWAANSGLDQLISFLAYAEKHI